MANFVLIGGQCSLAGGQLVNRIAYDVSYSPDTVICAGFNALYSTPRHPPPIAGLTTWAYCGRVPLGARPEGLLQNLKRRLDLIDGVAYLGESGCWEDGAQGRLGFGALAEAPCRALLQDILDSAAGVLGAPTHDVKASATRPAGYAASSAGGASTPPNPRGKSTGKRPLEGSADQEAPPAKQSAQRSAQPLAPRPVHGAAPGVRAAPPAQAAAPIAAGKSPARGTAGPAQRLLPSLDVGDDEDEYCDDEDEDTDVEDEDMLGDDECDDDECSDDECDDDEDEDVSEAEQNHLSVAQPAARQGGPQPVPAVPNPKALGWQPVECGTIKGEWDARHPLKFYLVGSGGFRSQAMSGNAFQELGGKAASKKWRASVCVILEGGKRQRIGKYAAENGIDLGGKARVPRPARGGGSGGGTVRVKRSIEEIVAHHGGRVRAALAEALQQALDEADRREARPEEHATIKAAIRAALPDQLPIEARQRASSPWQHVDWYARFPDKTTARSINDVVEKAQRVYAALLAGGTASGSGIAGPAAQASTSANGTLGSSGAGPSTAKPPVLAQPAGAAAAPAPTAAPAASQAAAAKAAPAPAPGATAGLQCYRSPFCTFPYKHSGWCNSLGKGRGIAEPGQRAGDCVLLAVKEEEEQREERSGADSEADTV